MFALIFIPICCSLVNSNLEAINGYTPTNDVSEHAKIELDYGDLSAALAANDFVTANTVYSTGGNSIKSDGSIRTIKGFSVSTLEGTYYQTFKNYWNKATYADAFTSSACRTVGTGVFAPSSVDPVVSAISKVEGCLEGAVFQNIWMYVIHEMAAAVTDCNNGVIGSHWDEAVAFYTGSQVGPTGNNRGNMPYATAVKRCPEFGTCYDKEETKATVNAKIFESFTSGQDYHLTLKCALLQTTMDDIVSQMIVPHIQGFLKYLYYVNTAPTEKGRAEHWSFAAAILPLLDSHSESIAANVKSVAMLNTTNTQLTSVELVTMKSDIEKLYPALGITCADIGGLSTTSTTGSVVYIQGMEPCSDPSSFDAASTNNNDDQKHLPDYGIGLLVFFFLVIGCCVGLCTGYWYAGRNKRGTSYNTNSRGDSRNDSLIH